MSEPERRSGSRRAEDSAQRSEVRAARVEAREKAQRLALLNSAFGAVALLAVIATVTTVLLWVQSGKDQAALDRNRSALAHAQSALQSARSAVRTAAVATQRADLALAGLQQAQQRQGGQIEAACVRLNIQRVTANVTGDALYGLFRVVLAFPATRPRTRSERRADASFQHLLRRTVYRLEWTPLTNCVVAVAISGAAYRPPVPVHFIARRPPASAMSYRNAGMPQPLGSVP